MLLELATKMSLLLLFCKPRYMFEEMLDRLELILEDFLNLLRLEAEPKILSSHDFSLWLAVSPIFFLLSGVDYKLLVS